MTYHDMDPNKPVNDPNRPVNDPYDRPSTGVGWAVPAVIAAFVLIAGLLFYNTAGERTTTASNDPAATRQTNPSSPAAPPATPPAKTQ